MRQNQASRLSRAEQPAREPFLPAGNRRILVIDDNHDFLEPVVASLCAEGHIVRATTQGRDLPSLVGSLDPDILITDILMEGIDVFDAIAELRQSRPKLKIIAMSGHRHLLTQASKYGANHVLAKPFPLERLNVLLRVTMQ